MREYPGLCATGTPISPPDQGAMERASLEPLLPPDLAEPPVYAYHIQDVTYEGVPQYGTVIVKTADEAMLKFTAASASANRNVKQNTAAADND